MEVATIGLDISKHVFHIHAVDGQGQAAGRQRLRRGEIVSFFSSLAPCLVGIEACATAHHWAREIRQCGHDVRLIPPAYVKPYVRRGAKNDAADAAAICEAVSRPNMRFVPIKSAENQGFLMLHRAFKIPMICSSVKRLRFMLWSLCGPERTSNWIKPVGQGQAERDCGCIAAEGYARTSHAGLNIRTFSARPSYRTQRDTKPPSRVCTSTVRSPNPG